MQGDGNVFKDKTLPPMLHAILGGKSCVISGLELGLGTGLNASVSAGEAIIQGFHVKIDASLSVAIAASTTQYVYLRLSRDGLNNVAGAALVTYASEQSNKDDKLLLGTATAGTSSITGVADMRVFNGVAAAWRHAGSTTIVPELTLGSPGGLGRYGGFILTGWAASPNAYMQKGLAAIPAAPVSISATLTATGGIFWGDIVSWADDGLRQVYASVNSSKLYIAVIKVDVTTMTPTTQVNNVADTVTITSIQHMKAVAGGSYLRIITALTEQSGPTPRLVLQYTTSSGTTLTKSTLTPGATINKVAPVLIDDVVYCLCEMAGSVVLRKTNAGGTTWNTGYSAIVSNTRWYDINAVAIGQKIYVVYRTAADSERLMIATIDINGNVIDGPVCLGYAVGTLSGGKYTYMVADTIQVGNKATNEITILNWRSSNYPKAELLCFQQV